MRTPSIGIAPEGYHIIGITAVATLASALVGCGILTLLCFAAFVFACNFFRDPERVIPQDEGLVVSPADGRVISVKPAPDPISGEARTCISIFMHVGNVHVNRAPVAGEVEKILYIPGTFFNASWDQASTDNERCAYAIKDADGRVFTVVQIAGLIARRIVCRVEQGDRVGRGERFGLIKFGSRLDVCLPEGYEASALLSETVLAGSSIIARKTA